MLTYVQYIHPERRAEGTLQSRGFSDFLAIITHARQLVLKGCTLRGFRVVQSEGLSEERAIDVRPEKNTSGVSCWAVYSSDEQGQAHRVERATYPGALAAAHSAMKSNNPPSL